MDLTRSGYTGKRKRKMEKLKKRGGWKWTDGVDYYPMDARENRRVRKVSKVWRKEDGKSNQAYIAADEYVRREIKNERRIAGTDGRGWWRRKKGKKKKGGKKKVAGLCLYRWYSLLTSCLDHLQIPYTWVSQHAIDGQICMNWSLKFSFNF